eukprot:scaffold130855_cov33-Phaeocystis_antarctica.AAC.1
MLTGKPSVTRPEAVAVKVPPPRKAARSCGSVGPSGGWCQILSVTITEPPTALISSTAEGSHEGLMALRRRAGLRLGSQSHRGSWRVKGLPLAGSVHAQYQVGRRREGRAAVRAAAARA